MTVLVTGAGGLVGSHLAGRLALQGECVRALVRSSPRDARLGVTGIEQVHGDLGDEPSLAAAARGCDIVYHMAAARGRGSWQEYLEVNVRGTERLARAAARAGVRTFVHASTRGVHGRARGRLDERTPIAPDTGYRRSKALAEEALARVAETDGLRVVIVRLPGLLGARATGWLGLFAAIARGGFRVIGSGRNRQHPCHVDDAVSGILRAGRAGGDGVDAYLLGGGEVVSAAGLVQAIAAELGVRVARVRLPAAPYRALSALRLRRARWRGELPASHAYEMFLGDYEIDDSKARRELGYLPERPVAVGIRDTLGYFRAAGML